MLRHWMFTVLESVALLRNPQHPQRGSPKNAPASAPCSEQILRGYGRPLFAGREPSCRRPMDIVLDPAVSGEKLIGRRILKPAFGPQCFAGNQADDETFRACGIDMPAREFDALRRRIENCDRIERQRQSCPHSGKRILAWRAGAPAHPTRRIKNFRTGVFEKCLGARRPGKGVIRPGRAANMAIFACPAGIKIS
jgi:hypothetical protein